MFMEFGRALCQPQMIAKQSNVFKKAMKKAGIQSVSYLN
jgi:hypothetical protein